VSEARGRGESRTRLVEVMRRLRPDGRDWDRAQPIESPRPYVLEEAFEVVDAIDLGDRALSRAERGDLRMQVELCAELARAAEQFEMDDVVDAVADELERRHPHVFGDEAARARGVRPGDGERLEAEKKGDRGLLDGMPRSLPALVRAVRVGERAAAVGYDWPDAAGVRAKIAEELSELDTAADRAEEERELGDLLFAIASWARKRRLDPEAALRGALNRFGQRLAVVERRARAEGVRLERLDAEELDARWEAAKAALAEGS
jgi:MazG family protein